MEDWKSMAAAAVTGDNPYWNFMATAAFEAIEVAHDHFASAAEVCGRFRQELHQPAHAGDAPPYYLPTAMEHVRSAILCTRRVSVYHAGSGHAFYLCTTRIGLQDSAPLAWQRWEDHHADAIAHAAMALQRLHSAWAHGGAASDAVFVMLGMAPMRMSTHVSIWGGEEHAAPHLLDRDYKRYLEDGLPWGLIQPQGFPLWDAWGHAAEQLLRRAADELTMARDALDQMRAAVDTQFSDAREILASPAAP